MTRLSSLLLALMFSVLPTADMVCRARCTPDPTAASAPSCHDVTPPTLDGVLLPAVACQRDAGAALAPANGTRNLVAPAPVVTAPITAFFHAAAPAGAATNREAVRPRPPQAYPSTIVLRI
jgi:hypothetical protein